MNNIKLFITDIDGVWTDGSMYYTESGDEIKRFHTYDSAGVLFCKLANIVVAIMTSEQSKAVLNRANKLGIRDVYIGAKDKVMLTYDLMDQYKLNYNEVAFIGDDINDYKLLQNVGLSACPIQSPEYIKKVVDWVLPVRGGEGAFRYFVEKYLYEQGILSEIVNKAIIQDYKQ